jgi:hypothetical protein
VLRLLILLGLLGAAGWGHADEKPRAVLSIEDLLIAPKQFTVSPRFSFSTDQLSRAGMSSRSYSNSLNLNYGLNKHIALSWQYASQRSLQNDARFGASTQALGLRWRIPTQGAWQWNVSAYREIHASHTVSELEWARPASNISIQTYRFIDPLVLSTGLSYHTASRWRVGGALSPESRYMQWNVAMDFAVNRVVGLYTAYQMSGAVTGHSGEFSVRQRLSLGGSYRISGDTSVALTLGFGLADIAPATLSVQGRYRF